MKSNYLKSILVLFVFVVFASCEHDDHASDDHLEEEIEITQESPEEKAVTQAVMDAYAGISFETGTKPDMQALRDVFTPYAVLINFRYDTASILSFEEFMSGFEQSVEQGAFSALKEEEIYGETEVFGKIGHRISTYVTYINDMDTIRERGVNSFQLIKTDEGWKVVSIIWDVEKDGQPIPEHYANVDIENDIGDDDDDD